MLKNKTYSYRIENKTYSSREVAESNVMTKTFIVTLNGNGAKIDSNFLSCEGTETCEITLPNIEREGYVIDGFSVNRNSTKAEYKANSTIKVNKALTLYAITHKDVTGTFIENRATLSFTSNSCTIYNMNNSCSIKTPSITRNNYASLGFSKDAKATSGEVKDNSSISLSEDATYYVITKISEDGVLEGCTGYMAVKSKLYKKASTKSSNTSIKAGTAFTIIKKSGDYFYIDTGSSKGYVLHKYVMINLSDYIPSIIYNITNADASIYKSSGYSISGVTGKKLYDSGKVYNERLKKNEYIAPVMYSFAGKILKAEKAAIKEGYTLKIYDSYRPHSVTNKIYTGLSKLYNSNSTVKKNINKSASDGSSWGKSWFLAKSLSAHNTGSAIDVTLVYLATGEEVNMPTAMHELSTKAIKYKSSSSSTYSKAVKNSPGAKKLDKIMKNAGMQTLASEWWHFQENSSYSRIKSISSSGCDFQPTKVLSY